MPPSRWRMVSMTATTGTTASAPDRTASITLRWESSGGPAVGPRRAPGRPRRRAGTASSPTPPTSRRTSDHHPIGTVDRRSSRRARPPRHRRRPHRRLRPSAPGRSGLPGSPAAWDRRSAIRTAARPPRTPSPPGPIPGSQPSAHARTVVSRRDHPRPIQGPRQPIEGNLPGRRPIDDLPSNTQSGHPSVQLSDHTPSLTLAVIQAWGFTSEACSNARTGPVANKRSAATSACAALARACPSWNDDLWSPVVRPH